VSDEAPSTRHGDVLLTVWIIVGATVLFVLWFADTMHVPRWGLGVVGALAAGYGEAVSRALRPHVRVAETSVAVVIAFVLLPQVARWGGKPFDRDAIITMVVGIPLGLGAAWQMRRWNAGAGNFPEVAAGIFLTAASVALGIALLIAIEPNDDVERYLEASFLLAAIAAGLTFGGLVPGAHPGHLIVGAMAVVLAPRMMSIGWLQDVPSYEVVKWTGALGVGGTAGILVGRKLRKQAIDSAPPKTNLPEARVVDDEPR
jgi:hypothetical protein